MGWLQTYLTQHPVRSKRILDSIPGIVSWSLILFPIWGSLVIPGVVSYFIILFTIYWVYRSFSLALLVTFAHFKLRASQAFDWLSDVQKSYPNRWRDINHLIIIPTYQEPLSTLERTLAALTTQTLPSRQLHVMLSFEQREGASAQEKLSLLRAQFGDSFGDLWATFHPDIPGEVKGKSANTSWGARRAYEHLSKQKCRVADWTISSEDADALFDRQYFAALTHAFLSSKKRYRRIWQGGIVFYNNIWRVPVPIRVLSSIFSMTNLYALMRRDRLINFSSYSTSLQHVLEIDFWDTDVIPEDYRLFFKSYFFHKGDFEVEPIFLPVYADAAEAHGFRATMVNQYEQLKRWAWGVSDFSYLARQFILAKGVPLTDKIIRLGKTIEDHFLWPVNWFIITLAALFPPLLNPEFSRTVLGKTLPQVTSTLLTGTLVSMVVLIIIDGLNRPPRPGGRTVLSYLLQPLEFVLLPVLGFFFAALPGIDAHTRLMLGNYLEYRVTEKV